MPHLRRCRTKQCKIVLTFRKKFRRMIIADYKVQLQELRNYIMHYIIKNVKSQSYNLNMNITNQKFLHFIFNIIIVCLQYVFEINIYSIEVYKYIQKKYIYIVLSDTQYCSCCFKKMISGLISALVSGLDSLLKT